MIKDFEECISKTWVPGFYWLVPRIPVLTEDLFPWRRSLPSRIFCWASVILIFFQELKFWTVSVDSVMSVWPWSFYFYIFLVNFRRREKALDNFEGFLPLYADFEGSTNNSERVKYRRKTVLPQLYDLFCSFKYAFGH